jgi:TonB family protein
MLKKIFKMKNKNIDNNLPYGAFELKKFYQKYASKGLIFAIALHIIAIGAFVFSLYIENLNADKINENDKVMPIIILEEFEIPILNQPEPELPQIEEPVRKVIPKKDLEALIPQPVKRDLAEVQTTKRQDELQKINVPVSSTGDENASNTKFEGNIKIEEKKEPVVVEKPVEEKVEVRKTIIESYEADKAPSALNLAAISNSMNYPQSARDMGIEGRVTARVLVDRNGNVERIASLNGPSAFHSEVRNKIMGLRFTPAISQGQTIKCWVTVPFNFRLESRF